MATVRKLVFRNEQFYHIFNRGIERRDVFTCKRDLIRAKDLLKFYKHAEIPIRFSQLMLQPVEIRSRMLDAVYQSKKLVEIHSFCLMPNHFHFLLKQKMEKGVATFTSNFTNAYTKYFNTKNNRLGPLFEGVFKAVLVETDEQLMHLTRYIHLNPVSSSIIAEDRLKEYPWSSYLDYLSIREENIVNKNFVLGMFKNVNEYENFTVDQIDYAKQLDVVKHLSLE